MTERTDKQFFVTSLIVKRDIQTPAINHGKAYESIAVKNMKKKPTLKHECALLVSNQYLMLNLTADQIVNENQILEVKCLFSANKMISPDTVLYYIRRHVRVFQPFLFIWN